MYIETTALSLLAGLLIWGILRWLAATPKLLTDAKACRGDWAEARIRGCDKGIEFTGIPVEPLNTFSNLAYLAAGWITYRTSGDLPSIVLAIAMAFLCLGSSLYHGTKTMWGARLDHAGMYAVIGALAILSVAPQHSAIGYVMAGGALAMAIGFAFVFPGDLNSRMGLLVGLMSIRAFLLGSALLGGVGLGVFIAAFISWNIDKRTKILGRAGHAIWHMCTAAAIALMFLSVR